MSSQHHSRAFLPSLVILLGLVSGCRDPEPSQSKNALKLEGSPRPLAAVEAGNELNGGYEEEYAGMALRWSPREVQGSSWELTSDIARSGKRAMLLRANGVAGPERVAFISDPVSVRPGDVIDFEVWALSLGEPKQRITVVLQGCQSSDEGSLSTIDASLSCERISRHSAPPLGETVDAWQPIRSSAILVPTEISALRFLIAANIGENPKVRYYVDDFTYSITSVEAYAEQNRNHEHLPDILAIGVDALRQSVLSVYGEARTQTPHIDTLAATGRSYRQVTSQSSWTKPSFASVFTSLYPSQHGAQQNADRLSENLLTLPEILRERGYITIGFVYSRPDGFLGSQMGHAQGFDIYFEVTNEDRLAAELDRFLELNSDSLAALRTGGGGVFLFYHVMAPHTPYVNPDKANIRNLGLLGTVDINDPEHITPIKRRDLSREHFTLGQDFNEHDIEYIKRLYEMDVNKTDALIGSVLDRFERSGLLEELNIVLFSDHGETFGENGKHHERNGNWGHGHGYQTNLQTPLILRLPDAGGLAGRDEESLVSNLDIMPTLLELAGTERPSHLEGGSLLDSETSRRTAVHGISEDLKHGYLTIRDRRYKLLLRNVAGCPGLREQSERTRFELYDLRQDPDEQNDISHSEPTQFRRLLHDVIAHCNRMLLAAEAPPRESERLSRETEKQLRALGYLD